MKRLLLVALMALVALVGIVGFSHAGNAKMYYLTKNSFEAATLSRLVIPDSTWPVYPKSSTPVTYNTPVGAQPRTTH